MKSEARLQLDHRRHMVRRLFRTPQMPLDRYRPDTARQIMACPDMVKTPPAITGRPVTGAIGPPGIENFLRSEMRTDNIMPSSILDQTQQPLTLDRRVADDIAKLLRRPDILGQRRDIEIADKNGILRWGWR